MKYMFIPLEDHPDYGYGMIGSTYAYSAQSLSSIDKFHKDWYSVMPVNYLRRHSIELFLKSGIILFHKKFSILFNGQSVDSEPHINLPNGKWMELKKTHNLSDLYAYMMTLINNNMEYLENHTNTDWNMPIEMDGWMNKISGYDNVSDYFRYPISRDAGKDKRKNFFKETSLEKVQEEMGIRKKSMTLILEDGDGNISRVYSNVNENSELYDILEKATDIWSGFHAAVRAELFDNF